jgi:uncharacterized membrane protein
MSFLRWAVFTLVLAWLAQYAFAMAVPYAVMGLLYKRGGEAFGYNRFELMTQVDANSRAVVRPSPDLLYAMCIYDLSDGPLRIVAPVPDRYWSMQFYRMNTDNFAGISNQRSESWRSGTVVDVTLIGPDHNPDDYAEEAIRSPTSRGVVLLRASAIGDRAAQEAALRASSCRGLR